MSKGEHKMLTCRIGFTDGHRSPTQHHHKRKATTRLLRSLHFNRCRFADAALHQYLSLFAHLTHVDLGNNRTISDHGLCESLSHLCLLTSLNVESTQATDDTLRIIAASLQGLQFLNMFYCRCISDVGVGHLQLLSHLQHLDLRWCVDVTSDGLHMIASSLHHLQHLDVSNCPNVTDAGVEHLVTSSSLSSTIRYLGLSECKLISSYGLNRVASLSQLQSLQIAGPTNVTDSVFAHLLGTLQHLTQLDIGSCESITTAGLSSAALLLADRPLLNLTKLDLGWWQQLTDEGLGSIVSFCPNLVALHLPYCENLTDDGIARIASLHDLQLL
ncbi:receptor-type protein kinase, putative, partial [Bodo saltans]